MLVGTLTNRAVSLEVSLAGTEPLVQLEPTSKSVLVDPLHGTHAPLRVETKAKETPIKCIRLEVFDDKMERK
jgi:hypothetical protein